MAAPAEVELAAAGTQGATVLSPVGATDSRPVLIVLSDAQETCRSWRDASRGYGFVLCPRPARGKDGQVQLPGLPSSEKALRAFLGALRRRFKNYISPGPVVLAAVGSSAVVAVSVLRQEPAYFARIALVDGGFAGWSSGVATIFATHGGKRALFVCTEPACAAKAADAAVLSRRAGAVARSVPPGDVTKALREQFMWLVEDAADWKPPGKAP